MRIVCLFERNRNVDFVSIFGRLIELNCIEGALYQNITIWQLPLGWPINLGWWGWQQADANTVIDGVYLIHNQNWMTSNGWPETASGQCVVGGIYGTSSIKSGYRIRNVFVETACSCAVGLEISDKAYNRHLTAEGCVGSIKDLQITNMFFDEEFFQTGGYNNFLRGERTPNAACVGDLSGKIIDLVISGEVAGRELSLADFTVPRMSTVPGLVFQPVTIATSSPSKIPTSGAPTTTPSKGPTEEGETSSPSVPTVVVPTAVPSREPALTSAAPHAVEYASAVTLMLLPLTLVVC